MLNQSAQGLNTKEKRTIHYVIGGLAFSALFIIFLCIDWNKIKGPDPEEQQRVEYERNIIHDYSITAVDLNYEYHENEVVADEKYRGKRILVVGTIKNIAKDFMGKPYITLTTKKLFNDMKCEVTKEDALNLRKGQYVGYVGTCAGMTMGIVSLKHCTFLDPNIYDKEHP